MFVPEPDDPGEPEEIICIEYVKGRPCGVTALHCGRKRESHHYFDVDWSEAWEELYFHLSGGGPAGPIEVGMAAEPDPPPFALWIKEGVLLEQRVEVDGRWVPEPLAREGLLARGYVLLAEPLVCGQAYKPGEGYVPTRNPLLAATEGDTIYCEFCNDRFPVQEAEEACEHIAWCDKCGDWVYVAHARVDGQGLVFRVHGEEAEYRRKADDEAE